MSQGRDVTVLGTCGLCEQDVTDDGEQRMIVATGSYVHATCLKDKMGYDCTDMSRLADWVVDPIGAMYQMRELLLDVQVLGGPDDLNPRMDAAAVPRGWEDRMQALLGVEQE